jgi:hypothetical protein
MIRFRQFLLSECVTINAPNGIFIKVTPTNNTIRKLCGYFYQFEEIIPLLDDFHCTLLYSNTPAYNIDLPYISSDERFSAIGTGLSHWAGQEGKGYIVLNLVSPELAALNKKFSDAGFKGTFPDYHPHVSLIHPVPDFEKIKPIFDSINEALQSKNPPLSLSFYYGGYTIADPEEK